MKRTLFLTALFFFSVQLFGQATQTHGISGPAHTLVLSDPSILDFDIHLVQHDQHPIPSAEYGKLKEALIEKQHQYAQASKGSTHHEPTRGTATTPLIFKGAQGNTSNSVPNDNDIAVSNDGKVVSVVNSNLRVYDDTLKVLYNKTLTALFTPIGVYSWISDPRIIYDAGSDRFILVCFSGSVSFESTILVGFTQTNDPAGAWNFYTLNGNSLNDSTWSDYPIIAVSDKDLFITFNQVKDSVSWTVGFKQSVIWQIDKQNGYNANPLQYTLWSDIKYNGVPLRNICPAKYQSNTMGNNMYFLTLRNVATSNDSIFLTEITDSYQSGNAQISQRVLQSPVAYGFPPNARQKFYTAPQQYLMTNDARVLAAIYENDQIHFGSNTVNPLYINAGVFLADIKNVSSTTPQVDATIFSSDSMEFAYPSMTYMGNAANDHSLLYTFSHCYVDSFSGTSILYKDKNGNFSPIVATKNGLSNVNVLTDSVERWGDYTNIQRKYNTPGRAYVAGSWAKASGINCWVSIIDNQDFATGVSNLNLNDNSLLYPNPSINNFNVEFTLTEAEKVSFDLYDMQGQHVACLLNTFVKAGHNEFSFSTQPLTAGNYVFTITHGSDVISRKTLTVQ